MIARFALAGLLFAAAPTFAQTAAPVGPSAPDAPRRQPVQETASVSRNAPVNGVLTLFGNERCPTNKDGAEVVVCVRRGAEEQFRIPKELREFKVTPENEAWAVKEQATLAEGTGVNSIGSCSVVGPGGQSGCFVQHAKRARAEGQERKKDETIDLSPY